MVDERTKRYKAKRKALGLCSFSGCPNTPDGDFLCCVFCREKQRIRGKDRYQTLKEGREVEKRCLECNKPERVQGRRKCQMCIDRNTQWHRIHADESNAKKALMRYNIKKRIVEAYGGRCVACGEQRIPCLEIDHIANDGQEHRASLGFDPSYRGGISFYRKVLKLCPLPNNLQVLCANCHAWKHADRWNKYE